MLAPKPEDLSAQETPRHIAAVDMGSNSFHMVVAKIVHDEVRILDRLGEKVQLAAGIDALGMLDDAAQARALECLQRFNQRIRDLDASAVQIVGTNALRIAKNRTQFLRKAEAVMGFPIEIISGREEARLIYLGVSHSLSDDHGKRLVIDIGGGSTELIIGERFESLVLESLHMGCVSYREQFFAKGELTAKSFKKAVMRASQELLMIKRTYRKLGWQSCVGSSGSVKAVFQALSFLDISHDSIEFSHLKQLKERMIELGDVSKLDLLGVKKERASIFPAGFAILYACFKVFKIESMAFANGALREGLLYDIIGRNQHEDVRERSITALQLRYDVDLLHATHVETTVLHAYRQVAADWDIASSDNQNLLRWASQVFEVGLALSHTQYHKHGAYLIKHSDLPGFSKLYQLHLSTLVRTHRRKFSDEVFADMTFEEQVTIKKLCVLFRLSVVLTAARRSGENKFHLGVKDQQLFLDMGAGWLKRHPLTLANLKSEQSYLAKQGFRLNLL